MDKISDLVTGEAVLQWLIIFLLIAYFVYKEYPDFKRRITGGTRKELAAENVAERLAKVEKRLDAIDEKLANDFKSLEALQDCEDQDKELMSASLAEREIIMRSLLAIIDGLHELGANGPTTAAHEEINAYLSKQAHRL